MHRILHTQRFLQQQGIRVETLTLHQVNKSTLLLHEKGRLSLGKRMRHCPDRYFVVSEINYDLVLESRLTRLENSTDAWSCPKFYLLIFWQLACK